MSWMLSMWVAAALPALYMGESFVLEGMSLYSSGYHLCVYNETRTVSFLAIHKVPFPVTQQCKGWLNHKMCSATRSKMVHQIEYRMVIEEVTRCCDGHEQLGQYCALPVNRSREFTTKPGSCPTAYGGRPGSEACEWDINCRGWQKCCHRLGCSYCTDPASPSNFSQTEGCRFNATVTVKADYEPLMSTDGGHLDHVRLLQAMVTGALQADVSVYYLSSWPVHPYRTATSLLIECNSSLSLHNVTSKLHLLLAHIQEVSSVSVEDINECAQPALHQCSPHANCTNTEGSYFCTCQQGYTDVDPTDPGVHCRRQTDVSESTTTELLQTCLPPMNTTYTSASNTTQDPLENGTVGFIMTTDQSNTTSVPSTTSHTPPWTSSTPYTTMRSTVEPTLPTTTCAPPSITSLRPVNVTGTSFSISWSSSSHTNQTYQVIVRRGSKVVHSNKTSERRIEYQGLQHGMLYNVTVTPIACGSRGVGFSIPVRTDAQTFDATTRLININFTDDLLDISSQAYKDFTESFRNEIYQSLPAEIKDMVRIEITGLSEGSVVVNFTLIFIPSQSQNTSNVSTVVIDSLLTIAKFNVDKNNTSIKDFDECASGENDCFHLATCTNTLTSYKCFCPDGFEDWYQDRPGRACQAIPTMVMTTPPLIPTTTSTISTTFFSQTTPTTDRALITETTTAETTAVITSTSETLSTIASVAPSAAPVVIPTQASTTTILTTTVTAPTTTPPAGTISTSETITSASITTTSAPETTTTVTTTTPATTTSATTATTAASVTTTLSPTTIFPAPTTTSTFAKSSPVLATTIPAPTTTLALTTTIPTQTTSSLAPTTTTPAAATTMSTVAISTPAPITTFVPTTRSTGAATTSASITPITPTSALKKTTAALTKAPPSTIPAVSSTRISPKTTSFAPTTTSDSQETTFKATSPSVTITQSPKTTTLVKQTTSTAPKTVKTRPKTTTTALTYSTISTTTSVPQTTALTYHTTAPRTATNVLGEISVQCKVAAITVAVAKEFLQSNNIKESALYLGLPACGVTRKNNTHVELTVAWNKCVTRLVHNETFYTASVTLFNSMDQNAGVAGPKIRLKVPIMCTYMKNMLISSDFGSIGYDTIKDAIMGSGSFQVTVQLMNGTIPLPHNYSLSSEEDLVVEVSMNTSSEQIKVVINKCWATPTPNPRDTYSHTFMENSCSLNTQTKVLENGNSSTSRVSVKIFSIVNLNVIYLHCQVHICVQIGSDTCVPDCLKRTTARSSNTIGTALGSSGPVQRSDEDSLEEELNILHIAGLACLGIGISLVFIIGFVCLFYYQRNRIGHYNFSVKPKQENFTYLVFNT
ncbi:uromodulin-like 1 [Halichoeres trimaculatus]|uniref:uromodulin-like 1 n=1 Tax=Halichoeres trimaculatus TaxID=147232 RepID=UPI003D9E7A21